jgi:class 3 adenylate cyclase
MDWETDVRHVLPSVSVPTLVLSRAPDAAVSRHVAERIPDARYHELPGNDSFPIVDYEDVIDSIRAFAERPHAAPSNAVLATLLFTDIVRSTETAAAQGDAAWRELLAKHHAVVRAQLSRFRGVEIDTSGDGFFARFDDPPARFAAPARSALRWQSLGSLSAPVSTRASANCSTRRLPESRSRSVLASQHEPRRARCSSRRL